MREHDVVVTLSTSHHTLVVAIECRDLSRPVGVPALEAFAKKCEHTGINQGIVVSAKGFTRTAREKAKFLGIRLLDLAEAESFAWMLAPGITITTRSLVRHNWTLIPEEEGVVDRPNMEVLDETAAVIDPSVFTSHSRRFIEQHVPHDAEPVEEASIKLRVELKGFRLRSKESGAVVPATRALVTVWYRITSELVPYRLMQYRDEAAGDALTDVVTADIDSGTFSGSLMFINRQEEGGHLVFIPHSSKDT